MFSILQSTSALARYLARPHKPRLISESGSSFARQLVVESQVWKGIPWQHHVTVVGLEHPGDFLFLEVTGGDANPVDIERARMVSERLKCAVAVLFNIPNQPIWELTEDDLIAHTFVEAIDSDDETWPLLFPMVQSVIGTLDVLEKLLGHPFRTLVTGASKRGWTSWLAGASGDPRIVAIMPRVIEMLNVPDQLAGQLQEWGHYSPMLEPYTSRGLMERVKTEQGRRLALEVDPFTHRELISVPTYIVAGSNDPYWTVDAARHYLSSLNHEAHLLVIPNEGHNMGDRSSELHGSLEFAGKLMRNEPRQHLDWNVQGNKVTLSASEGHVDWYVASGPDAHFEEAFWTKIADHGSEITCGPGSNWSAVLGQVTWEDGFTATTRVFLSPPGSDILVASTERVL